MRRVPHPDAPGLGAFVDDARTFLDEQLFRTPLRSGSCQPDAIAASDALWSDALTRGVRTPAFRLVRAGAILPPATYCRTTGVGHRTIDDVIQPNRVLELYESGATLVLQGLHFTDPHLARTANNLALALDHPVQVNAYLSPPAARGLDLHFDYHDVFVVQLDGAKRWRVWAPLERTRHPVRSGPTVAPPTLDELGPPMLDLTIRRGDCLYLPRGHPHAAETVDSASAHLTVGIVALTWNRVLTAAVRSAVAAGSYRTAVSPGPAALAAEVDALDELGPLREHLTPRSVRRWMLAEVWRRQPATRLRPRCPPPVSPSMPVAVTPGPLVWLDVVGDRAVLGLGDRELTMPVEAYRLLAGLLRAEGPVRPVEVDDGLDDESRSVVVQRLAAEGVIAAG